MVKQQKRNVLEELANRTREVLDELGRVLQPQPQREPARIPVPVRTPPRKRRR